MPRQKMALGQVYAWSGGSLWIGQAFGATERHAHHAVQVTLGWSGPVEFDTGTGGWRAYGACLIPNDVPHAFRGDRVTAAHIFIEPESTTGKRLLDRFGRAALRALTSAECDPAARLLFRAWRGPHDASRMIPAALETLALLAGSEPLRTPADPRVMGAIEIIQARLDEQVVSLTGVARELHISPSRLRHLFVEETGLPFRRYVLWQRLQRVFSMMTSASLTEAAHAAGFADAAHMTRTFRAMMGVAPTTMDKE